MLLWIQNKHFTTDFILLSRNVSFSRETLAGNAIRLRPDQPPGRREVDEFIGTLAASNKSQIIIDNSGVFAFGTLTETELTLANGHGAQDEFQTVTLSNATGGIFRLAYKGQTTLPLAYNASAATVDAALEALSTLGASAVTVSLSGSV